VGQEIAMKNLGAYCGLVVTLFLLILAGCGGGGGTTQLPAVSTVSGVAATGAPILGKVALTDKNGLQRGPFTTDTAGNFSFDVTGLSAPFILRADWASGSQSFALFSVATESGIANINPFTNLTLQLATSSDPAALFGTQGVKPDTSKISDASISAAQLKIKGLFAPLCAKYGITDFNPLSGSYVATPDNKLDSMLDVISITMDNGVLSVTNKLDGSSIAHGTMNAAAVMPLTMINAPDLTVLTDIREITQTLALLRSTMNLGADLKANSTEGLFMPEMYYGTSNGHTRSEDMASIVAIFGPGGTNSNGKLKSIQNLRLVSDQTANYSNRGVAKVYQLKYDFIFDSGTIVQGNVVSLGKELSSGLWKFIGDASGATTGGNSGFIVSNSGLDNTYIVGTISMSEPVVSNSGFTFSAPVVSNTGSIVIDSGLTNTVVGAPLPVAVVPPVDGGVINWSAQAP
jgi:hypothetical protein